MKDLLLERWNSSIVTGDIEAKKPSLLGFRNTVQALEILRKHIQQNSRIAVHCDVDLDGVGCGYIVKSMLKSQGAINNLFLINKEKLHGIQQKHVDYFNNNTIDLLIIVDSSSNELDIIKKFNCDVVVIDHHEIGHEETYIKGEYEYVIINNMLENKDNEYINEWMRNKNPHTNEIISEYEVDERMSGALVLYELLRVYCEAYRTGNVLENLLLYQWVGVTLFSDSILLCNDRNQWYIENTVHRPYTEGCLSVIMSQLNEYKATLDKSFISYTLAPTINKAIRAGFSGEALDIVLRRPQDITNLNVYKDIQAKALEQAVDKNAVYRHNFIMKDITNMDISKNYCGVIASRLCGDNAKNTVVFKVDDGIARGSFRGKRSAVDYRGLFKSYGDDVFAEGHKAAFGFGVELGKLREIMSNITTIEPKQSKFYLTAGSISDDMRGDYHIEDMTEFKKLGYFWRLAIANSKLSSEEQLDIITSAGEAVLIEERGKLLVYDVLGIKCKAFEPISSKLITIYIEYSTSIEMYVKNLNI